MSSPPCDVAFNEFISEKEVDETDRSCHCIKMKNVHYHLQEARLTFIGFIRTSGIPNSPPASLLKILSVSDSRQSFRPGFIDEVRNPSFSW